MNEKKLIKLGGKVARGLINILEEELSGEKRKKEKKKDGKGRKKLFSNTGSTDSRS